MPRWRPAWTPRRRPWARSARLVLVAAANAVDPVVTYLAALAAGHPVLLAPATGRSSRR